MFQSLQTIFSSRSSGLAGPPSTNVLPSHSSGLAMPPSTTIISSPGPSSGLAGPPSTVVRALKIILLMCTLSGPPIILRALCPPLSSAGDSVCTTSGKDYVRCIAGSLTAVTVSLLLVVLYSAPRIKWTIGTIAAYPPLMICGSSLAIAASCPATEWPVTHLTLKLCFLAFINYIYANNAFGPFKFSLRNNPVTPDSAPSPTIDIPSVQGVLGEIHKSKLFMDISIGSDAPPGYQLLSDSDDQSQEKSVSMDSLV
ncbi:hypothetical protein PAXINDRAFT_17963 [Paxillus involutus ATCC 200175]|uniref:Uncharacterized protein n=1 Tax=Paxillus involutus ATCC 200175 TaxID=664439 RepID=A0A0C9T000_PAXIN|nr:hypothetical protein PAXINDRAFT_17963 [Paxillus involutus ATCC 200175]